MDRNCLPAVHATGITARLGALPAFLSLALAACGGGGAGSAGSGPGTPATPRSGSPSSLRATRQAAVIAPREDALVGALTPTADAAEKGMWSPLVPWPVMAAHATLLPDGRVLSFGTQPPDIEQAEARTFDVWTPALGLVPEAHRTVPNPTKVDSFCTASTMGPDGMVLMVGGDNPSLYATTQWDPDRDLLRLRAAQPQLPRYYATLVRLGDNRILLLGGNNKPRLPELYAETPEVFTAATGWRLLRGAKSSELFGKFDSRWWYPRAWLAADGRVVGVSNDRLWRLDPAGDGHIEALGETGHRLGVSGTGLMFRPGKLLLLGGGQLSNVDPAPATAQATVVDFTGPQPQVMPVAPMAHARNWGTAVVLPDGQVMVTSGTSVGNNGAKAVFPAELWQPDSGQWRLLAPAAERRLYHSLAMLLPSGAVLNAGGGSPGPIYAQNAQVFFPPYFFRRAADGQVVWADRPGIRSVPPYFGYGPASDGRLLLRDARRIASVALISAGAVTHSHSTDMRYVPLPFSQRGRQLTLHLSQLDNLRVPPGHYQLHVVDTQGVPSAAAVVEFRTEPRNIAPLGSPSQSSTWSSETVAGRAIDGRLSGFTATGGKDVAPSWRLDLPQSRPLSQISLFNRLGPCEATGDCRTRLRDITVSVLDDAGTPVWTSALLNPENELASPDRLHIDLTDLAGTAVRGRSIVVRREPDPDLSGSAGLGGEAERRVLSLTEVLVEEGALNLALHRPASQSSTAGGAVASRAVDGGLGAELAGGSVTQTASSRQPWWQVDLGSVQALKSIRLWNRFDPCCAGRLADFHVLLSESPFGSDDLATERQRPGVTDLYVASLDGERAIELAVPGQRSARYLRVWLNGSAALSLAEVEVFAP